MSPTGLYLHLPFCASKCAYCDFNSIVADDRTREDYFAALLREIQRNGRHYGERIFTTVYLGGGTPTIYDPGHLGQLLHTAQRSCRVAVDAEITLEANPRTVTAPGLLFLRELGYNRVSLGVQSLNEDELRLLGRRHSAQDAREAIAAVRAAGFDNLSLDLINCLPGQTPEQWQSTLDEVVFWMPEHVSCYGLSIEEDTPLHRRLTLGQIAPVRDAVATEIYERTHRTLTAAGYEHYEIANYARPGRRSRHNENYWRNGEYAGIGAGATSYLNGFRIKSDPAPERWAERVLAGLPPPLVQRERLDRRQQALEVLMLALRTRAGLDLRAFCHDFGLDIKRYELRVQALVEAGLAEPECDRLVLTPIQGFLLHSEIVQMFM